MGEAWAGLDQGERIHIYDPNKNFLDNSAKILTLDSETWFIVSAQALPKETLWTDLAKEREDILQ